MVVHKQDPGSHCSLIGSATAADKREMRRDDRDAYQAWLVGELLLVGLLGAALALFLAYPDLRTTYDLPALRLALDTGIMLAATIVAVLAGIRFSVEGRRLDLMLCAGFTTAAATSLCFGVAPVLGGARVAPPEEWSGVGGRVRGLALIAATPWTGGRVAARRRALRVTLVLVAVALLAVWLNARALASA